VEDKSRRLNVRVDTQSQQASGGEVQHTAVDSTSALSTATQTQLGVSVLSVLRTLLWARMSM
jgi:hypothetical protein